MLTFHVDFLTISALRRRFDRNDALLAWWIVVPMVFFLFFGFQASGLYSAGCSAHRDALRQRTASKYIPAVFVSVSLSRRER